MHNDELYGACNSREHCRNKQLAMMLLPPPAFSRYSYSFLLCLTYWTTINCVYAGFQMQSEEHIKSKCVVSLFTQFRKQGGASSAVLPWDDIWVSIRNHWIDTTIHRVDTSQKKFNYFSSWKIMCPSFWNRSFPCGQFASVIHN